MTLGENSNIESFDFTTRLRAGRERDYERFHRAIPAELERAMRAAGVVDWRIFRSGTTLTHAVEARSRAAMSAMLDADPVNVVWQQRVAAFLDDRPAEAAPDEDGALVWSLDRPPTTKLALGCAQLGNLFRPRSDDEANAILEAAWAHGIRHFDTAPHYGLGLSERRLGAFLRTKPREQFTVSTKVGRLLVSDPSGADRLDDEGFAVPADFRRKWDFSAQGVRASLEASLERLGLDRVDTVLIHDPNEHADQALAEAAPALVELRDTGVIGSAGVGNRDTGLLARFVEASDIDVVMLAGRYTLLDQSALDELLPRCLDTGVAVLNAAVFNSGVLANDAPSADSHFEYGDVPRDVLARAHRIAEVCTAAGTTLPAAALWFATGHPAVRSVVVGADDATQVARNARILETPPPDTLWPPLVTAGLLRADAPWPIS